MTSAESVRSRLEGYARAKIASILQPLSEKLLVVQPQDPVRFMVQYLIEERSDLRSLVADETLAVEAEQGRGALPEEDHPLLDRCAELSKKVQVLDRLRRKEQKRAELAAERMQDRILFLQRTCHDAGVEYEAKDDISLEMEEYLKWEAVERDESPHDAKNHDEFVYRSYTSMPMFTQEHTSMLAQLLKADDFGKLRAVKTSTGFTFSNLIQSGVVGHNTPVGIMLGDDECIALYGSIIAPMAQALHGKDLTKCHHVTDTKAESCAVPEEVLDLLGGHITSVTLRTNRNLSGFPLAAGISSEQRSEVLAVMRDAIRPLMKKMGGEFSPLQELDPDVEEEIEPLGILMEEVPKEGSAMVLSGCAREWPADRAIWYDGAKRCTVWVNGLDHVSIMVHSSEGDLGEAWGKFAYIYGSLEDSLGAVRRKFASHLAFGFLTSELGELGCAFHASMTVKILAEVRADQVKSLCQKHGFRSSIAGDQHNIKGSEHVVYEVVSKSTTGVTEAGIVNACILVAQEMSRLVPEKEAKPLDGPQGDDDAEGY